MHFNWKQHSVIPGFGLTLGYTVIYLSLIVLLPLSALFIRTAALPWDQLWHTITEPRVMASYRLTFGASFFGAAINVVFGFIVAWCLVRYRFPGRKLIDALVDLPFALPTAVSGIALTAIYAKNGWLGQYLEPLGIKSRRANYIQRPTVAQCGRRRKTRACQIAHSRLRPPCAIASQPRAPVRIPQTVTASEAANG